MPDRRTLIEKLQAMAAQTEASPYEARLAVEALARLRRSPARDEPRRVLSREEIMSRPDRRLQPLAIRVKVGNVIYIIDDDGELSYEEFTSTY